MSNQINIKICGIRTPQVAAAAVEAGADRVGVVFVERSPRFVTLDEAKAVAKAVGGRAEVVGLFKGYDLSTVRQAVEQVPLTMLQLHGEFADDEAASLSPTPVIRAVAFDVDTIADHLRVHGKFDALMIDSPDRSQIGGGTGHAFDWPALREALDKAKPKLRIILAGGLTPDNVAEAARIVRPWGVDVSSGVESRRGIKDIGKIRAFCQAARAADHQSRHGESPKAT